MANDTRCVGIFRYGCNSVFVAGVLVGLVFDTNRDDANGCGCQSVSGNRKIQEIFHLLDILFAHRHRFIKVYAEPENFYKENCIETLNQFHPAEYLSVEFRSSEESP